uniref:CSON004009 protein n=1 Tax=Culicoides sonorensis TaxID=179676 RepID=A0A336L2W5_CULSO
MKQFLGIWYAIQKTTTASTCIIYNITESDEPGEFNIEQVSQHFALGLTPLKHEYSYTGTLRVVDKDLPAKMSVKYPLSVAGSSKFTVFATDYTTYAGIFTCQKLAFSHRQSATILSRTKTLDKIYVDKLRNKLASYNVDPFDMSIINQTGCPKDGDEGYNIHIDQDTFSAKSIGNAVKKAGEAIGTGVEYTISGAKKWYNKLKGDSTEEPADVTEIKGNSRLIYNAERAKPVDDDAEWIHLF